MTKREVKIIKINEEDAFFEDKHLFEGKIMMEHGHSFSFIDEKEAIKAAKYFESYENGEYENDFIFGSFEYEILKTGKRKKI